MENIMVNSKVKSSHVFYLITGMSIILIITIFSSYFRDIEKTSWEIKKEIQINNARVAADYISDFFDGRKASLALLGKFISGTGLRDNSQLEEQMSAGADLFDNIVILDTDGSIVYGHCENIDTEDIDFTSALAGECVVAGKLSKTPSGGNELYIYAPVTDRSGKVEAVLAASLLDTTLSSYIEKKILGNGVCAAIMNSKERIMYGSSNMAEIIGEPGASYFSFIKTCDILTEDAGIEYIQSSIRDNKDIFLNYRYNRNNYISACVPAGINECYLIYIDDAGNDTFGIKDSIFQKTGGLMGKIFIADIILLAGLLIYHIANRTRIMKLLDDYAVIDRQEGAMLFEYTFYPRKIEVYGDYERLIGKKFNTLKGEEVFEVYDIVHEDDASIRGRLHEFFDSDSNVFSSELRILHTNGEYGWFRLTGIMFRGYSGKCERFIGKIVNANRQISMEKNLVMRAENDLLTGILNKKTIEAKITESLARQHEGRNYIFFMVDLDNFKNVNDTLGHIFGDKAIADTAKVLTGIFHSNSHVGRLGGDEFAVFVIYDAFDEESLMKFIVKSAEKICAGNRREYTDGANTVNISSSVGIAIGPKDGQTFELLYKRADEALYASKNTGKDKYTIYNNYTVRMDINKAKGNGRQGKVPGGPG